MDHGGKLGLARGVGGRTHGFTKKSKNCIRKYKMRKSFRIVVQIFGFPVMCIGTESLNNENLSYFMAILVSV